MKRIVTAFGLVAFLAAAIGLSTAADNKTMTWSGWISDSHCGAKGMSADHKACAKLCVTKNGSSWVFVNNADKKVIAIHNQDAVNADKDLGAAVKVTGHLMDDGSLHIDAIAAGS
jgi:hypothetical protein